MTKFIAVFIAFIAFTLPAGAAHYIEPTIIPPTLLTPPPAVGSELWKKDIDIVYSIQQSTPQATLDIAASEEKMRAHHITAAIDESMTDKTNPRLFALLTNVLDDCKGIVSTAKKYWNTKRPFAEDERIQNKTGTPNTSPAYPSGHTACSRLMAEVAIQLYPDKREELLARAGEMAANRVAAGVHYMHDLMGGGQLAILTLGALQTSANYRDDLALARAEIKG